MAQPPTKKITKKSKPGRNDPCFCGSGLKYKQCHLERPRLEAEARLDTRSVKERNLVLLDGIESIFGLNHGAEWADVKRNISGREVRELYKLVGDLWKPGTNAESLLAPTDDKLRALYLGPPEPYFLMQNVFRFSLYADEILLIDPFDIPWNRRAKYNPIYNPEQFIQSTLKKVLFVILLAPWIRLGLVSLVPDPSELDMSLRLATVKLAEERARAFPMSEDDFEILMPLANQETYRAWLTLDPEHLKVIFRRGGASEHELDKLVAAAKKALKDDPLGVEAPIDDEKGHLLEFSMGTNLETGVVMANQTGAFPYTDIPVTWRALKASMESLPEIAQTWTPLTQAFSRLDFKFLNNVDPKLACSLREDGRLENLRMFLRRLWAALKEPDPTSEAQAKAFAEEVVYEHGKAEAEWRDIDTRVATTSTLAMLGGLDMIKQGHLVPALGAMLGGPIISLWSAQRGRKSFRQRVPLSVFIDLKAHGSARQWWNVS